MLPMPEGSDPYEVFQEFFESWRKQVESSPSLDATTCILSTVHERPDGQKVPSSRPVNWRGVHEGFFRYVGSGQKLVDITKCPKVSMLFYMPSCGDPETPTRYVKVKGSVTLAPREETEAYFFSRPEGSQISAMVSQQSTVVLNLSRATMIASIASIHEGLSSGESKIQCPEDWNMFHLSPTAFEFWQECNSVSSESGIHFPRRFYPHTRMQYHIDEDGEWIKSYIHP